MVRFDQQRLELGAPGVAAGRERAERIAVVALPPRDDRTPLRLADLDEICGAIFSAASIASEPPLTR